ncbi:MAG: replication-associated recombination protein A [Oscillospiraceae bacterium]|nr:replication-associated recombination protein A [Oscillospiraceae bacterium]
MSAPLADRLRPQTVDEMVGQRHLLGENMPLRNIIESGYLPNLIFYGPSGTGKTTLARIIAKNTNRKLHHINGTNASTADIKAIVGELDTFAAPNGILLYLDEIQYFNKKQQQSLLEYIESGQITLIASTTENPYFYIYSAVLSRCTVFEFKSVTPEDVVPAVKRAFRFLEKETGTPLKIEDGVEEHISVACGGDVRKSLNFAELCVLSSPVIDGEKTITLESTGSLTQKNTFRYDKFGDEHYDILSAYQKSMRGSDPDAALHYLARLLEAGDMLSAIRRLLICAAEDVGLAYPMILPIVKSACDIALQVGMPEASIPLGDAVVLVATSPKSNTGCIGIESALADVKRGNYGKIPRQLQNKHYDGEDAAERGQHYLYPHSYPNRWVKQQYLPDAIKDKKYYTYGNNKTEQAAYEYWKKIKGE